MIPDADTNLYCVMGSPISHSKSPLIHNACFRHYKINSLYLAFDILDIDHGIRAVRTLDIKGVSVTIPHKEMVMSFLDRIDDDALEIGAVNTIKNDNNVLTGSNTDFRAAVDPLLPFGIRDKKVYIIGAGGAARAVVHGISKEGGKPVITNRNEKRGESLATKSGAGFISLQELNSLESLEADIVINTTSLGMHPDIKATPFNLDLLEKNMIVMDIVYNPVETKLLKKAKEKGCETVDGLSMFLNQGAAQFQTWTGIVPGIEIMKKALEIGGL